jgi:hypothetical protein
MPLINSLITELILILLQSPHLLLTEWAINFCDEFNSNSLNLNRWKPQTSFISEFQILSLEL